MFASFRTVKTRKNHRCSGCAFIFPKGSTMVKWAGTWDGEFSYGYNCPICHSVVQELDPGETYCFGDLRDDFEFEVKRQGRMFVRVTPHVENLWKTLVNERRRHGPIPDYLKELAGCLVEVDTEKFFQDSFILKIGQILPYSVCLTFVDDIVNDMRLGKWVCTCCHRWFETETKTCPHCKNGAVSQMVEDFDEAQEPRKILVAT